MIKDVQTLSTCQKGASIKYAKNRDIKFVVLKLDAAPAPRGNTSVGVIKSVYYVQVRFNFYRLTTQVPTNIFCCSHKTIFVTKPSVIFYAVLLESYYHSYTLSSRYLLVSNDVPKIYVPPTWTSHRYPMLRFESDPGYLA